MPRYLIVGGVAGGASTAARLRRLDENAEIILFERGAHISYANCGLPYYAGDVITERERLLVMTPDSFRAWLNVDVRVRTEAVGLDRERKVLRVRNVDSGVETEERYDALVLSPGAEPIRPPLPGMDLPGIYTLRSVPDADRIKAFVSEHRPRHAVVVGGGFIGIEMAENLRHRGVAVTVVEALDQVMNVLDSEMVAPLHRHLRDRGVELALGTSVKSFSAGEGGRLQVSLSSGQALACDLVLMCVGVRPDTGFLKGSGIELARTGAIVVDGGMRTSDPHVYALGDAVEVASPLLGRGVTVPLAGPALKQARVVASNVAGTEARTYGGPIGTSIVKVFDLVAATTGVTEKTLRQAGRAYRTLVTHGYSHAGYYPGAMPITIKTVFDPETGRLLGAQVVGYEGVDKRIDLLAECVRRGASVVELADIEHAYAPPYSSARDPVNIAGMAAENVLRGLSTPLAWNEVQGAVAGGACLVDVRTAEEFSLGTIPGSINVPHDQVRERLSEIPRDRAVVVFCSVGLRGYLVERILRQRGWSDVRNLSGGYKTWEMSMENQAGPTHASLPDAGKAGGPASTAQTPGVLATPSGVGAVIRVDACGLQCPGPIMRLKKEMDQAQPGSRLVVSATDPGFKADVASWTRVTGNLLVGVEEAGGVITATLEKSVPGGAAPPAAALNDATFIVFSDDLDRALASFVLANGAVASGKRTTMFFTFWGLSVLKRPQKPSVAKDFMGRMFGMMLPGHAGSLGLSKMNFGGAGGVMMKARMKARQVDSLETMMQNAIQAGVRIVACQMSMDIMGIAKEELVDGVEIGGVATYMEAASQANVNLFI